MNHFIPNSYQTPNALVDLLMPYLTCEEWRVLSYAVRHILGFQDRISKRQARMSISTFEKGYSIYPGCGLSRAVIIKALNELSRFRILTKIGEPTKDGQLIALAFDEQSVDMDTLKARQDEKKQKSVKRTQIAREKRSVGLTTGQSDLPLVSGTNQERSVGLTSTGQSDLLNQIPPSNTPPNIEENKDSAVAKAPAPRERNPWYDAIHACWGFTGGRNGNYGAMLQGKATRKGYKEYNLDPPLSEPGVLLDWKHWYLNVKNKGKADTVLCSSPEKVQSSIGEFRANAMRVQPRPQPTSLAAPTLPAITPRPTCPITCDVPEAVRATWEMATRQLESQFDRRQFDTYIRPMTLLAYEVETRCYTIGAPSEHDRDYLDGRLRREIVRTLENANGGAVAVNFEVMRLAKAG